MYFGTARGSGDLERRGNRCFLEYLSIFIHIHNRIETMCRLGQRKDCDDTARGILDQSQTELVFDQLTFKNLQIIKLLLFERLER